MSSGVYDVAVNAFAISAPVEVTILVTAQGARSNCRIKQWFWEKRVKPG